LASHGKIQKERTQIENRYKCKSESCFTIHSFSKIHTAESIDVEFIRFEYDVEKAAKAVEDSPLPDEYAEMLRKGY